MAQHPREASTIRDASMVRRIRPGRKRRIRRRPRSISRKRKTRVSKAFTKRIKKAFMVSSEVHYKDYTAVFNSPGSGVLGHNTLYELILQDNKSSPDATSRQIFDIQKGDGVANRTGDTIYFDKIVMRGTIQWPGNRPNPHFKMWLVEYNPQKVGAIAASTFFRGVGTNYLIDAIDNTRYTAHLLYDSAYGGSGNKTISNTVNTVCVTHNNLSTGGTTYQDFTTQFRLTKLFRRKLTYDDTTTFPYKGMGARLSLVMLPYGNIGSTTGTDTIVNNNQFVITSYWKDM